MPPYRNPVPAGLKDYVNLSGCVGLPISKGMATLHEMETVYSLEDAWDMLEIMSIDNHNERVWNDFHNRQRGLRGRR